MVIIFSPIVLKPIPVTLARGVIPEVIFAPKPKKEYLSLQIVVHPKQILFQNSIAQCISLHTPSDKEVDFSSESNQKK
jgi:hypothetical protein